MNTNKVLATLLLAGFAWGAFAPALAQEIDAVPQPPQSEEAATSTPLLPPEEAPATEEPATTTPTTESTEAEAPAATPTESDEAPVELIVKFHEDDADLDLRSGRTEAAAAAAHADAVVVEHLRDANSAVVQLDAGADVEDAIDALEGNASVAYAEPNYPRSFATTIPTDPEFGLQWALENTGQTVLGVAGTVDADIDATDAWDLSLGTSTIVAVIDNGVLYTHPDLVDSMWDGSGCVTETGAALGGCNHGYDYADNDVSPLPLATSTTDTTHGTHVAGIIAAQMNNATGTVGVAPSAKLMALRFGLDVASEVKAIDFAIRNGSKVINASYGGSQFSQAEYEAIARFRDAGGIFIAAAGNDGTDNDLAPEYPASYDLPNIVSVAATDNTDGLAAFSSGGSNFGAVSVDLGAPGRSIRSTVATGGVTASYGNLSGTSMAAPQVAGVAALLRSLYPSATTTAYVSALVAGGDAIPSLSGKTVSGKRLNALGALEYLASDVTAPVITLIGSASVSLSVGGTYSEQGATAFDDIDGSVPVTIGGDTVSTSVAGTYTVTYDAEDQAGNHAVQATRTVTVSVVQEDPPRRRSGGGGGGGGGSRSKSEDNPARELFTAPATGPYASMTPEQRAALLSVLLDLLAKLQAQLAILKAQGL